MGSASLPRVLDAAHDVFGGFCRVAGDEGDAAAVLFDDLALFVVQTPVEVAQALGVNVRLEGAGSRLAQLDSSKTVR